MSSLVIFFAQKTPKILKKRQRKFFIFFADNLWLTNNSFLWTAGLKEPLFRVVVTVGKNVNLSLHTLLNKTGHCRLTMPFVYPPRDQSPALEIAYSGNCGSLLISTGTGRTRKFAHVFFFYYLQGAFLPRPTLRIWFFLCPAATATRR